MVEVIDLAEKKNETGLVTVRLSTFNQAEVKVFEGELTVLVQK